MGEDGEEVAARVPQDWRERGDNGNRHTLAGIILDGQTASGDVEITGRLHVGKGYTLGEGVANFETRHFDFACVLIYMRRC